MTAEEFCLSQLRHLQKAVEHICLTLYPGLSEALTTRLRGGEDTTAPRRDGHVQRFVIGLVLNYPYLFLSIISKKSTLSARSIISCSLSR